MATRGINKVIILGRLGNTPDYKETASGSVCTFSVATSERWINKSTGRNQERTEWHRIVLFGQVSNIARDYLSTGDQVYIEGQLRTRKWTDAQERTQYSTEVVVQGYSGVLQLIGGAKSKDSGLSKPEHPTATPEAIQANTLMPAGDDWLDDIPF